MHKPGSCDTFFGGQFGTGPVVFDVLHDCPICSIYNVTPREVIIQKIINIESGKEWTSRAGGKKKELGGRYIPFCRKAEVEQSSGIREFG